MQSVYGRYCVIERKIERDEFQQYSGRNFVFKFNEVCENYMMIFALVVTNYYHHQTFDLSVL